MVLKKHSHSECGLYTPIEHFTSDEVWNYIYSSALPWLDAARLGQSYAQAAGDGGECRTLLEGIEGEQPGCAKSARFGCWMCTILTRDRTLANLSDHYDYMADMEAFRNWLVDDTRQWGWHYRDVYRHGTYTKNIYDRKNHREGMNIPGGFTLEYRQTILKRLMELDDKVIAHRGCSLISDAELTYIQECWIEEGDLEMSVTAIAHNRDVVISKKHEDIHAALQVYRTSFYKEPDPDAIRWFASHWSIPVCSGINKNANGRYFAQLSLQLLGRGEDAIYYAQLLTGTLSKDALHAAGILEVDYKEVAVLLYNNALDLIDTLPVEVSQYYPSPTKEKYIRDEWKRDRVGFLNFIERVDEGKVEKPAPTLFGYEGDFGLQFEQLDELREKGDITECESISLQDKMAWFD